MSVEFVVERSSATTVTTVTERASATLSTLELSASSVATFKCMGQTVPLVSNAR